MSIRDYSREEVEEMAAVEVAHMLLEQEKKPYPYLQLIDTIAKVKGLNEEEKALRRTKVFTSMNLDGRFVHLGENHWGLKAWYPVDKTDEDLSHTVTDSGKGKAHEDGFDHFEDYDEGLEDLEDELDELSHSESGDVDLDEDDDLGGRFEDEGEEPYPHKDGDED
ncbi:DNA-directed RNA polymerase subunit delta [Bacillus sp. FJAT-44742]|uniref:DNA-directed RNA polymerase subunit delta n=1 Tax=Bacillus sp. FJAT-44742 TaxID=2014005 RepID=UPI0012FEF8ED|nr:DNA-directed RNA polymerase subunit delta [Bacillus sp. FJAT-44742]